MAELKTLQKSDFELLWSLGELILGIDKDELGEEFIHEADAFISNLDDFLIDDLKRLLKLFNSRFISFLRILKFTRFVDMTKALQEKYYQSWTGSRIPLLRTGSSTLRALCGWSYYSLEKSWDDLEIPGKTIGREDKTPTLLEGKQPWEKWKEEKQ